MPGETGLARASTPPWSSAEANDTLHGLLYAYERADERHLRHKLGYWRMVEKRMIRETTGETDPFAIAKIVADNHRHDASYREISAAFARRNTRPAPAQFTAEELSFLADHFEYANDPEGQSVRAKALRMMERLP